MEASNAADDSVVVTGNGSKELQQQLQKQEATATTTAAHSGDGALIEAAGTAGATVTQEAKAEAAATTTVAEPEAPSVENSADDEPQTTDEQEGEENEDDQLDYDDDEEAQEDMEDDEEEDDSQPKPQPHLLKGPDELVMPEFFASMESQWRGAFNQRMSVPYSEYAAASALGSIDWADFALVEDEENIRKGHHAVCPQVRCRKTGRCYRCKIVSCSRIHFNLTTLGFKAKEYEEEIRSYLMERQLLFALDHPFLRSGLGFFTDANFNFGVFLEDFPHGTLADYYAKQESGKIVCQFEEAAVRMITAQLLLALEYLHFVGCVHRDIQASNVLVDARGYVKLTDFAITAPVKEGEQLYAVTCFRYYAAPEYFNDRGYSFPVDFYALGLMLYEMLTRECFGLQEDIFDCDGSVDWGILPEELAALLGLRQQAKMALDRAEGAEAAADSTAASNNANEPQQQQQPQQQTPLLPDHFVPTRPAREFVDDCLIYDPQYRPDRATARFYAWFDGINFEQLYRREVDLPWRPDRVVSYQAGSKEEHPLSLVLDQKPVPEGLRPYTHLF